MKFAICQLESGASLSPSHRLVEPATSWVQFGDQLFVLAPAEHWDSVLRRADERGLALKSVPQEAQSEELFLVRQKGRLFQREHPDIPVLLNRGRYLVVKISEQDRTRIVVRSEPGYKVVPLQPNTVVFDERPRPTVRAAADPWVKQFVDRIERDPFVTTLSKLTHYDTRHSLSEDYRSVAQWCLSELQAMNCTTHLEEISVGAQSSHNVFAEKVGFGEQEQRHIVLVTAHLDSINWVAHGAPDAIAPGADDNGTGSAGLLEIARALQDHSFTHDLRLVLFGGEEEGLYGSHEYVNALSQADRARIKAVVNMDMIGGLNTESPSVTLESSIEFSQMVGQLVDMGHTYTSLKIETSWHYFDSDHVPFIDAGMPAVLTIEGADTSNHYVHTPDDILDHVSDILALDILRMNVAFVAMNLK
jgi:hypothetical protein